jgi:hypothetical protein
MTTEQVQDSNLIQPDSELDIIKQINKAIENNTTASDIRISRLAIQQPLSPESAEQRPGYEQGQIFDNLTREVLSTKGKPPWLIEKGVKEDTLTPLHYCLVALNFKLPSEYIKWIPRLEQEAGGDRWEFKTLDPKDPRVVDGVWVSHGGKFTGKKPPVTINTNYMLLNIDPELKMPNGYFRVLSASRSSAGVGQTIASILQGHKMQNICPWDRCYYLYTTRKDVPKTHYIYQIARGPLLKDVVEPWVSAQCMAIGKSLVGPSGELFQSIIINAATLGESEHTDAADDVVSTGNQQSASDDPFNAPTETEGGAGGPQF